MEIAISSLIETYPSVAIMSSCTYRAAKMAYPAQTRVRAEAFPRAIFPARTQFPAALSPSVDKMKRRIQKGRSPLLVLAVRMPSRHLATADEAQLGIPGSMTHVDPENEKTLLLDLSNPT
jgi:hypothetical protein